jgi:hypothetical protein
VLILRRAVLTRRFLSHSDFCSPFLGFSCYGLQRYVETQSFLPQLGWTFILVNIAAYALQLIIMAVYFLEPNEDTQSREGNVLYEANIVAGKESTTRSPPRLR